MIRRRYRRRSLSVALSTILAGPILLSSFAAVPAAAWCNAGISKWAAPLTRTLKAWTGDIPGAWQGAINASVADWNGIDVLHYNTPTYTYSGPSPDFQISDADFSAAGLPDFPAATFQSNAGATHATSSVVLNTDFTWNTTGVMNQGQRRTDVRTVTTHEIGHSSGLQHPNWCGAMNAAEVAAVMNPNWVNKWATNADDNAGIAAIY